MAAPFYPQTKCDEPAYYYRALSIRSKLQKVAKLRDRPVLTSFYGWILFPGMYLLVGILTALGVSVEASFIAASPAGLLGFTCWVAAFIISLQQLSRGQNIGASVGGLLSSFVPLSFLAFGFWVAANGGV